MNEPQHPQQPEDPRVPRPGPEPRPSGAPLHEPVWQGYGTPPADASRPAPANPGHGYGYPPPGPAEQPQQQQQPHPQQQQQPLPQQPQPQQPRPQSYPQQNLPQAGFEQRPFGQQAGEPDWSALADQHQAKTKRKRLLLSLAGVVALVLVGGGIAFGTGALGSGTAKKTHTQAQGTPTPRPQPSSSSASPSAPSSPSPAPSHGTTLTASGVLTAQTLHINNMTYTRKNIDTTSPCWKDTGDGLGSVLSSNNCTLIMRATYVAGNSSVTVGIADFPTQANATAAQVAYTGTLAPLLYGTGISAFCQNVSCATTHAVYGHFTYYTVAGPSNDAAGKHDPASIAAGTGLSAYALNQIMHLNQ